MDRRGVKVPRRQRRTHAGIHPAAEQDNRPGMIGGRHKNQLLLVELLLVDSRKSAGFSINNQKSAINNS
jgi:hypothetical protein